MCTKRKSSRPASPAAYPACRTPALEPGESRTNSPSGNRYGYVSPHYHNDLAATVACETRSIYCYIIKPLSLRQHTRDLTTLAGFRIHEEWPVIKSLRLYQPIRSLGINKVCGGRAAYTTWNSDISNVSGKIETNFCDINNDSIEINRSISLADELGDHKHVNKKRNAYFYPGVSGNVQNYLKKSENIGKHSNIGIDSVLVETYGEEPGLECILCGFNLKWQNSDESNDATFEKQIAYHENIHTIKKYLCEEPESSSPDLIKCGSRGNDEQICSENVIPWANPHPNNENCNDKEGGTKNEDDFDESNNRANSSSSSIMQHARHAHHASKAHHTRSHQHHSRHRHAHHHHMHHRHQHMHGGAGGHRAGYDQRGDSGGGAGGHGGGGHGGGHIGGGGDDDHEPGKFEEITGIAIQGEGLDSVLGSFATYARLKGRYDDDWIDRLNHLYTTIILIIFTIVVSTKQYVGEPIHCWCPAQFEDSHVDYTNNVCWVSNTYYVHFNDDPPRDWKLPYESEIQYYQWVPMILLFQALLFKDICKETEFVDTMNESTVDRSTRKALLLFVRCCKQRRCLIQRNFLDLTLLTSTRGSVSCLAWLTFLFLFFSTCSGHVTTALQVAYTNNVCWVANTYYVPFEHALPRGPTKPSKAEIEYYQWVPMILLFMALMFKVPCILWRILTASAGVNLDKIVTLAAETAYVAPDDRDRTIKHIVRYMDRWIENAREYRSGCFIRLRQQISKYCCIVWGKRYGNYLVTLYMFIKLLYLGNAIGQLFILNEFLGTNFNVYGFEVIDHLARGESWSESPKFPRITHCFFKIRQLQNVHDYTVQCVLPINLFNEKIFIFIWFWLVFVATLSSFNFLIWIYTMIFRQHRLRYLKKFLRINDCYKSELDKKMAVKFCEQYLRQDGIFVLRLVGKNANDVLVSELILQLWNHYRNKPLFRHANQISDDNSNV
ncbi:hypothetical protein RRG08_058458 [Elysia crispata]|uniref:Innexin n=2 Tax=Elysia TaxID=71493 RepID=A0AAE0Y6A7_9GAST|nr:hypothetical protein RRG08_058458 [Elysia crispata]